MKICNQTLLLILSFTAHFFISTNISYCQNVDSLIEKLPKLQGIEKAVLLCEISEVCDEEDIMKYSSLTLNYSTRINYYPGVSCGLNNIGFVYLSQRVFDSAIFYFKKAVELRKRGNEPEEKILESMNNLGNSYIEMGNYKKAYLTIDESSKFISDTTSLSYASFLSQKGILQYLQGNYQESLTFYDKALTLFNDLSIKIEITNCLNNRANALLEMGKITEAIEASTKAIKLCDNKNFWGYKANALNSMSLSYLRIGNIRKAIDLCDSSISISASNDFKQMLASAYTTKAAIFETQLDFEKALLFNKLSLDIRTEVRDIAQLAVTYINIGNTMLRLKKIDSAYIYFMKGYQQASDLNNIRGKSNALINIGHYFKSQKLIDSAIRYYRLSVSAFDLIEDKRGLSYAYFSLTDCFLLQNDIRSAEINGKLSLLNANLSQQPLLLMQSLGQLSRIYAMTGNFREAYKMQTSYMVYKDSIRNDETRLAVLKSLANYEFEVKEKEMLLKSEQDKNIAAEKLNNRENIIICVVIITVLSLLSFSIYFRFYKRRKEYEYLQSQQKSLNAQLKDHYIFGSLNTIKLQLKQGYSRAEDHLDLLSQYIRTLLNFSDKKAISLAEEVALTINYLNIEKITKDFAYDINIAINLDPENILVPPVILQPIVENSVVHGFSRLPINGEIKIDIYSINRDLILLVKDNGTGFPAKEPKEKHISFGTRLTKERIQIFNKLFKKSGTYSIVDTGNGVLATIKLPLLN